jgi:D-amino-acid oxidase
MNRRRSLSVFLCGLAATPGCRRQPDPSAASAAAPAPPPPTVKEPEGLDLVPVEIEPSFEIRTITGLRPFRSSGFMVRREDREGKILVHNYGHGGGGMTLSWGSSHLAIKKAGPLAGVPCAVIGGGVMGLSTARLLQLRGAKVSLYTDLLPPETTSNVAGAQCWPVSVFDNSGRTLPFEAQYIEAAHFSFRYFQRLVGPRWGVRWIPNYYLGDSVPESRWIDGPGGVLHDMQVGFRDFGPGEHIFPAAYARRFYTMMIEPSIYLSALLGEVQGAGAAIEIRRFESAEEILRLPQQVIFNCSGLGARDLFNDPELIPIKGQLSILMPQPQVNYNLISGPFYMFPRTDGVILGGTFNRNQWDLTPEDSVKRWVLDGQRAVFEQMRKNQQEFLAMR